MNEVKKFTTFDELKCCEREKMKHPSHVKKQNDFKKVIMDIRLIKTLQANKS